MVTTPPTSDRSQRADRSESSDGPVAGWRTVDIVVASAIGVAFGVVFWAWGHLWNAIEPAFTAFPPGRALIYGMWLAPAVLGALVIRKRGAAIYSELVAAVVSALLGTSWGLSVVLYGLVEGAAAEIVFAFVLYRSWRLPVAAAAGAVAGLAAALLDITFYYPQWPGDWQFSFGAIVVASSLLIAGIGSWLLVRAMAATGVLSPFPSGRDQARV